MKYVYVILLSVILAGCSFSATPAPTAVPSPTATPSTGWYDYETTEIFDESFWTPKDAESPEAYKLQSSDQSEFFVYPQDVKFIEKDGETFLDNGGQLYYWPQDLNQAMITDVANDDNQFNVVDLATTRYLFAMGEFNVVTKAFIKEQ